MTLSSNGTGLIGRGTSSQVSTDGNTCDFEYQRVEVPGVDDPITYYAIIDGGAFAFRSVSRVEGYPTDGPQDVTFVDLPSLVTPTSAPLHEPIEWEVFDSDVYVRLRIVRNGKEVWNVTTATDATTLSVPEPPSTFDVAVELGSGTLMGELWVMRQGASGQYVAAQAGPENVFLTL